MNYIQLRCSFCTNSNGCPNSKDFRNKVELYFYQSVLGCEIALFICPKSNCSISNNFCEKSSETFYKRGYLDLNVPSITISMKKQVEHFLKEVVSTQTVPSLTISVKNQVEHFQKRLSKLKLSQLERFF